MNDKGNLTDRRPPFLPMLIGTGLGSGFWPWGPGTAGSILGTLVWVLLTWIFPDGSQPELGQVMLLLALAFTVLGTWATARLQPYWGEDPSRVVIDEVVGVWIPLSMLSATEYGWAVVALVLFRIFDMVKPFGIKMLDRRQGAFWVMADDIVAGVYAQLSMLLLKVAYDYLIS